MLLLLGSGLAWAFVPIRALTLIFITISLRLRLSTINFVARIDDLILEHGPLLVDRLAVVQSTWQRRAPLFDDIDGLLQVGIMAAKLLVASTTSFRHKFLLQGRNASFSWHSNVHVRGRSPLFTLNSGSLLEIPYFRLLLSVKVGFLLVSNEKVNFLYNIYQLVGLPVNVSLEVRET